MEVVPTDTLVVAATVVVAGRTAAALAATECPTLDKD